MAEKTSITLSSAALAALAKRYGKTPGTFSEKDYMPGADFMPRENARKAEGATKDERVAMWNQARVNAGRSSADRDIETTLLMYKSRADWDKAARIAAEAAVDADISRMEGGAKEYAKNAPATRAARAGLVEAATEASLARTTAYNAAREEEGAFAPLLKSALDSMFAEGSSYSEGERPFDQVMSLYPRRRYPQVWLGRFGITPEEGR